MNTVKEIALSFCASAIFCAGIGVLGGDSLRKSGRYIVALIMLCSVVGAIASADIDLSFFSKTKASESEAASTEELSGYAAEQLISVFLKEKGIVFEKITAEATKNDEDGIVINKLVISGAREEEKIRGLLGEIGIDCVVTFE
jgi:hypothetical protein